MAYYTTPYRCGTKWAAACEGIITDGLPDEKAAWKWIAMHLNTALKRNWKTSVSRCTCGEPASVYCDTCIAKKQEAVVAHVQRTIIEPLPHQTVVLLPPQTTEKEKGEAR